MNLVVADTGPLLHLHQIGSVDLLGHLGVIHVTPTVLAELEKHRPDFFERGVPNWFIEAQVSPVAKQLSQRWISAGIVDPGEAEALAFAHDVDADCLLTDDAAARVLGESIGLSVRGTLGVLLHAAAVGHLNHDDAMGRLSDLECRSTLWMSAKVKNAARLALSRIFGNS